MSSESSARLVMTLAVAGLLSGVAVVGVYEATLPTITRNKAEALQRAVLQAFSSAKGQTDISSDGTEDYIDYAVSSYTREFSLSLSEMERKQLRLIEEALKRIDRGEFGRCMNCGTPIPEPRLDVEPWARYCIKCQELDELGLLEERDGDFDDDDDDD